MLYKLTYSENRDKNKKIFTRTKHVKYNEYELNNLILVFNSYEKLRFERKTRSIFQFFFKLKKLTFAGKQC